MIDLISSNGFATVLFIGLIALAVDSDVSSLRISNTICLAIAALYPVHAASAGLGADALAAAGAAVGTAAAVFAVGTVLFGFRLIGGGDVKLMAAIALWAGPGGTVPFLITTTLAGGLLALLMTGSCRYMLAYALDACGVRDMRDRLLGEHIPYGLAIAAGAYAVVVPPLLIAAA